MFYKLSNTCDVNEIEDELNFTFKYPNLYEPLTIINGLNENSVPVITSENPKDINFAIWGLLPEAYDDDWDTFQDVTNTLNTNIDDQYLNTEIYSTSLDKRRCLIVVNGFFTSKLLEGKLVPFHVHLKNHRPFCLAGVYNTISDGFLTCSILVKKSGREFDDIPNLGDKQPMVLKKKDHNDWLNRNSKLSDLEPMIQQNVTCGFLSHAIDYEFYDNLKIYKKIVNSDYYQSNMKIT
ncbi:MAG: SOS response-associated peptidase family protein [Psychroserpens sp.]|uniref:SOS response-associated peptidase family protein n=1 Tax=Psychroserpens sp. TaxID=2020870 RepID=UPI003C73E6F5